MSRIRILHLISSISFGGAERVVCELASLLDSDSTCASVGVMGNSKKLLEEVAGKFINSSVQVVHFSCNSPLSTACIKQISEYVSNNDIQIVHSHGYKSDMYAYLVALFAKNKIKLVATNHNWLLNSTAEKIYKKIDLAVLRSFNSVVAVSQTLFDEMKSHNINSSRLCIIDNGISIVEQPPEARKKARSMLALASSDFAVCCVASLTPEKSHRTLIRTLGEYRNVLSTIKLVLIGDGPLRPELEQHANGLRVNDQVIFLGHRSDVMELYAAFDAFALVSEKEGLPMALLEGMAAGLPVVATEVGAIPKVVTDGEQGFLVKPGDCEAIAAAFTELLNDPELRRQMGRAAYATVVEHYSSKRMSQEYESLYLKLLETK